MYVSYSRTPSAYVTESVVKSDPISRRNLRGAMSDRYSNRQLIHKVVTKSAKFHLTSCFPGQDIKPVYNLRKVSK